LYKSHIYNILRQSDRQGPSGCAKLGALLRVRSRPVESVKVELWCDDKLVFQAETDQSGSCAIEAKLPLGSIAEILVVSHWHAQYRHDVRVPLPDTHEVKLEPRVSLSGRAMLFDGRPAPQGTIVFAWPTVSMSARRLLAMRNRMASARVDAMGGFQFEDCGRGATYTLAATFPGWCTPEVVRAQVGSVAGPPVLLLHALYACRLESTLPDGAQPPASLAWSARIVEPEGVPGLQVHDSGSLVAGVSGCIERTSDSRWRDWRAITVLCTAEADQRSISGFEVELRVPGMEAGAFKFDMSRATDGVLRCGLQVRSAALGFGDLLVTDPSKSFVVPCEVTAAALKIRGMPFGVYDVTFESPFGWKSEPAEILIGPVVAEVVLSDDRFGVVVVDVEGVDTTIHPFGAMLAMHRIGGGSTFKKFVARPPYVAYGVPAGVFRIEIEGSAAGVSYVAVVDSVDVVAGGVSRCSMRWK
jgi:hypothetical protein